MTEPQLQVPLDGLFLSPTPPWGASVLVRRGPDELLLLRRRGQWGPPAATRLPDEPVATCAARALYELAGLRLPMWPLGDLDPSWIVFVASVNDQHFVVDADEYEWVSIDEARRRCTDRVSATLDRVA